MEFKRLFCSHHRYNYGNQHLLFVILGCFRLAFFRNKIECEGLHLKITFTRILMSSEYKDDLQHRFPTKRCSEIVLHLTPKKNQEAIPFLLIPE